MNVSTHVPVMMREVGEFLRVRPTGTYWDGTFGRGGHARLILDQLSEEGRLLASDRDREAAAQAITIKDPRFQFSSLDLVQMVETIDHSLDGFLFDLGVSTPQLKTPDRGFSFQDDGPLDMRMDQTQGRTAEDLVNELPEKELADLIYLFGEERYSRRIASRICEARAEDPHWTTARLEKLCFKVYPRRHQRIHPATRTFQALRIAVNDELNQLQQALPLALRKLKQAGRGVVISFHSLEDRIVKRCFRAFALEGYRILTKRPLVAGDGEVGVNPASRSAKLRAIEREA